MPFSMTRPPDISTIEIYPLTPAQWSAISGTPKFTIDASSVRPSSAVITSTPSSSNGYILEIQTWRPEWAEGNVDITVHMDAGSVKQDAVQYFPEGCATSTNCSAGPTAWVSSGSDLDKASTSTWECTEVHTDLNTGTVVVNTADGEALPPLFPGAPTGPGIPVCYKAKARSYSCTFPLETPTNNCEYLETNPACHKVKDDCLPENKDLVTDQCYFTTETWDCGTDTVIVTPGSTTTTSCGGPIRCMGTDCRVPDPPEVNDDFNNAAMQMQVAQWAQIDNDCATTGECKIFQGDGYTCKVVFAGIQNCCETPTGVSIADYIKMTYYTWKVADRDAILKFMDSNGLDSVAGAWNDLTTWASNTYESLSKPLVQAWESVGTRNAGSTLATAPTDGAAMSIGQVMQNKLRDWVKDTFGEELSNQIFGAGANAAFQETCRRSGC